MEYLSEYDVPSIAAAALAANGVHTGGVYEGMGSPSAHREQGAYFLSDVASATNGAQLQTSMDNVSWRPVAVGTLAAGVPLTLTAPTLGRYHRAVLTNGAGAAAAVTVQLFRRRI